VLVLAFLEALEFSTMLMVTMSPTRRALASAKRLTEFSEKSEPSVGAAGSGKVSIGGLARAASWLVAGMGWRMRSAQPARPAKAAKAAKVVMVVRRTLGMLFISASLSGRAGIMAAGGRAIFNATFMPVIIF